MEQSFIANLLLAIVIARLVAHVLRKLNVPPIASYMLVGIALGPSLLGLFNSRWSGSESLVTLSLLFLLFYAGLNVDFRGFKEYFADAIVLTLSGVSITVIAVMITLMSLGYNTLAALVIAISLSNTATEIVVLMLEESGFNDYLFRRVVIAASFFDDVLAVIMISIIRGGIILRGTVVPSLLKFLIAFSVVTVVSLISVKYLSRQLYSIIIKWNNLLMLATTLFFGLSYIFDILGIGATLGAYLAGLVISMLRTIKDPTLVYIVRVEELVSRVSTLLEFFIIPVFFIYVGCRTSISLMTSPIVLTLLILAIVGKFIGSSIPFMIKHDVKRGLLIGIAMNVRGSLEPAVALIALEAGIIDVKLFDAVVTVSLFTSLLIPILFANVSRRFKLRSIT